MPMKFSFLFILLFTTANIFAQPSDFITLKKKGRTIKTFFAGSNISFTTISGGNFNVQVNNIRNDSIFVTEFIIVQMPTRLGVYVLDTVARYKYSFNYKEIGTIYHDKKGFSFSGSGASLMGGGLLLLVASGVVYIADRSNFSLPLMGAAVGLGLTGYLLTRLQTTNYKIGKKYQLNYISVNPN
jgi:hypothetical protein